MNHTQADPINADVTWSYAGGVERRNGISLRYGLSRGLDAITTARRVLATSVLHNVLADAAITILTIELRGCVEPTSCMPDSPCTYCAKVGC